MKRDVPDDLFPDGEMNITTPGCTGIELWNGPSEELPVEQLEVIVATLKGDSAYELFKKHHLESNLTEEEYASLPIKAIEEANAARERIENTETEIRSAEQQRAQAETLRTEAEAARAAVEQSRTASESERAAHEVSRAASEEARIRAESERIAGERSRAEAEQVRTAAEAARAERELTRIEQEQTRIANEQARGTAFQTVIDETHAAAQAATAAAADLETPLEVLAHSDCTLDERLGAVERLLLDVLSGKVEVPELQVKKLGVWDDNNLVLTGACAPTKAPDRAGQFYIDTTARAFYFSTGNTTVADWKIA